MVAHVGVSPKVTDPGDRALDGTPLRLPGKVHWWPKRAALVAHRRSGGW